MRVLLFSQVYKHLTHPKLVVNNKYRKAYSTSRPDNKSTISLISFKPFTIIF